MHFYYINIDFRLEKFNLNKILPKYPPTCSLVFKNSSQTECFRTQHDVTLNFDSLVIGRLFLYIYSICICSVLLDRRRYFW